MIEPSLETAWGVLSSETVHAEAVHVLSIGSAVAAGSLLAGLDHEGRRCLMVPLLPGEAFAEDRSGRAVHLERASHKDQRYLVAKCLDPALNDVFSVFAEEVVQELSPTLPGSRTVVEMLFNWRSLFAAALDNGTLSTSQEIGLLAELVVLSRLAVFDPGSAIASWTGPDKSQHDFRGCNQAIEVKASRFREGRRHEISSVFQLSAPDDWHLALASFKFEKRQDGISIIDALNALIGLGVPNNALQKKLILWGVKPEDLENYNERWAILEERIYDVGDPGFPKIIPDSFKYGLIPPGTLSLSYTIDLSNEPPFPLSPNESTKVYSRITGQQ